MIELDIVVPTKGYSYALRLQLSILQHVLNVSRHYTNINLNVILTINDTANSFGHLITRFPDIKFKFNNLNLGFDKNVYRGISEAHGDYLHILSDNDYRSLHYWTSLFTEMETLSINKDSTSAMPLMIIPITKELNKSVGSYPNWYAAGISKLLSGAESQQIILCKEDDHLLATILQATSQISHVIVQRNTFVQEFVKDLIAAEKNDELVTTGLPQSIYTIQLMNVNFANLDEISFKPFFAPCLLTFLPETHRSVWFYDSTFNGQKTLYKIKNKKLHLPNGVNALSGAIISFLHLIGFNLLMQERVFHENSNIERWLQSMLNSPSLTKYPKLSLGRRIFYKSKKILNLYLRNLPIFFIRSAFILVIFINFDIKTRGKSA